VKARGTWARCGGGAPRGARPHGENAPQALRTTTADLSGGRRKKRNSPPPSVRGRTRPVERGRLLGACKGEKEGASGNRVGAPARCRRSLDLGSLSQRRRRPADEGPCQPRSGRRSAKERALRRAFACKRRVGGRSLRLMPSHSLTEARRHGGRSERRGAAGERTVPGTVSAVPVSEPLRVSASPVLCSPCLRASVRDHETASRTRHGARRERTVSKPTRKPEAPKGKPPAEVGSAGGGRRSLRVGGSAAWAWKERSTGRSWLLEPRVRPRGPRIGLCELHARPNGARRIHPLANLLETWLDAYALRLSAPPNGVGRTLFKLQRVCRS